MISNQKTWTIVIIGFWNRMIFTPQWVCKELFGVAEVEALVPLNPLLPTVYRDKDVSLQVGEDRVVFNARETTSACRERMEGLACSLLELLPKTPVSAIGVNFGFIEKAPEDSLLKCFNFSDDLSLGSADWDIERKKLTRRLVSGEKTLNLTLVYKASGEIFVDANFDFAVKSSEKAIGNIKGKTTEMYDTLIKLLKDVYDLTFEAGEDNA